ncbi:MAG: FAD-dependent oxidoreductase [Clostridia bacterium]|nr:FAD-dependent oxidoreductase [Clostridia bacterium]MBO5092060.1 FAD-dependent oxidoreductase [Clostridia bacterium]MBP3494624.1 FAD-dependent oxidoreductase [Clostridia bacterium]
MYDIIVVGGGPGGLTAALYARRANKTVLVIEKATFGGQITYSPNVENIPGFVSLSGNEFAEKMVEQVMEQGADVECTEVLSITDGDIKTVVTDSGNFEGKSVIIATGAKHRLLGLENEENLIGNGISFCAVCDGAFYENKTVAVIGGGNSALQEALMLTELCKKVYVVQNLDYFTGEKKLVNMLEAKNNVEIILGAKVTKLLGENELTGIVVNDDKTLELDGMFVAVGLVPQNEIFKDLINLNSYGYVDADEKCLTNKKGIFVAGDCRSKKIRQVVTACADGATAALAACDFVDEQK